MKQHQVWRRRYEPPARRQYICPVCANLPHRRPRSGCPRCDQAYAAEEGMTIAEALRAPRKHWREVAL